MLVAAPPVATRDADAPGMRARKLSYREQRELEQLPIRIDELETEQRQLNEALADPALYARDARGAARMHERLAQLDDELTAAWERWEALSR